MTITSDDTRFKPSLTKANRYVINVYARKWPRFSHKLWQRNYYERIIRTATEMNRIRQYIANNPVRWESDENNPKRL